MTDQDLPTAPPRGGLWASILGGLCLAVLFGQACEDGSLDDDDTPLLLEDDDDAAEDDDDAGPDDDDIVVPEGVPIGGTLEYQAVDGTPPGGAVLGGLFPATLSKAGATFGAERVTNDIVAADGALIGNATFAFYVPETLEAADLTPVTDGVSSALFAPFAYVDGNASGSFNAGDVLLGSTDEWVLYVQAEDPDDIPEELDGAGPGWNLVRGIGPEATITHHPEGVNSSQGFSIRVRLLPVTSGVIPVDAEIPFPEGSLIAGWHGTLSDLMEGTPPADPVVFVQAASNELREDLVDWAIDGAPAADHFGALPVDLLSDTVNVADLTGALYSQVGWVDDGDLFYDEASACDLLFAEGDKTLVWLNGPGENLWLAYNLAVTLEQRPGWLLKDDRPRRLAVGVDLTLIEGVGDDDDSAGDNPYDLPPECFGDDDDSAGDDDDSAADDDDSAP